MTRSDIRKTLAAFPDEAHRQGVQRVLSATGPLWPQLVPGVPLWSNGKITVQQHHRPGPDWFPVAVHVKDAA